MMVVNQMAKNSKHFGIVVHVKADVCCTESVDAVLHLGKKEMWDAERNSVDTVYGYHSIIVNKSHMYNIN